MDEKQKSLYFPMFVNLQNKKILVIGGGKVALRKTRTMVRFCKNIIVSAPEIRKEFDALQVICNRRAFREEDLEGIDLAIIATNDARLNAEIADLCEKCGILKNVASDRGLCDFYFPSVIEQDGVVIGIGSGGDPARSRAVRERLEQMMQTEQ